MDNTIFAQSIARIRVYETKLLTRAKLEGMSEAKDFEDALRMLQDTYYGDYVNGPLYEDNLKAAQEQLYKDMKELIPVEDVVSVLSIRYDAHNLKSLLKGKLSGIDTSNLLIDAGTISVEELKVMFRDDDFREMPETLRDYVFKALEVYGHIKDPQYIDITIDNCMYAYMLEIGKKSKIDYLIKITKIMIDITNIKTFLRVKIQDRGLEFFERVFIEGGQLEFDIFSSNLANTLDSFVKKINFTKHDKWVKAAVEEYEKSGDPGAIEKEADNFLMDFIKASKFVSFGPEPVIAYILARENEIKALRIVLTGKKNEVHPDMIKERLRDTYV